MVKKLHDRRGKNVKGGEQKHPDYYRVRVVLYLLDVVESNITDMTLNSKYDLSRANKGRLAILLEKMVEEKWIKKSKYKIYSLNEKGQSFANTIKLILKNDESDPLFEFEAFAGVKSLV